MDNKNKFAILVYDDDIKMCKQYKIWKNKLFDSFVDADKYKEENLKEYACYVCKIYF